MNILKGKLLFLSKKISDIQILAEECGFNTIHLQPDRISLKKLPHDISGIFLLAGDLFPLPTLHPGYLLNILRENMNNKSIKTFAEYTTIFTRPDGVKYSIVDFERAVVSNINPLTKGFQVGDILDLHQSYLITSPMPENKLPLADNLNEGFERAEGCTVKCKSLLEIGPIIGTHTMLSSQTPCKPLVYSTIEDNKNEWIISRIRLSKFQKDIFSPGNRWQKLVINLINHIAGNTRYNNMIYFKGKTSSVIFPRKGLSARSTSSVLSNNDSLKTTMTETRNSLLKLEKWFRKSGVLLGRNGEYGVAERLMTEIYQDGKRLIDYAVRTDCVFQTALFYDSLYQAGLKNNNIVARKLMEYLIKNNYQDINPKNASMGFWQWGRGAGGRTYQVTEYPEDIYANDSAWVILASAQMSEKLLTANLKFRIALTGEALLETQGKNGLRERCIRGHLLNAYGRKYYSSKLCKSPCGHFDGIALSALIVMGIQEDNEKYFDVARIGVTALSHAILNNKRVDIPISYTSDNSFSLLPLSLSVIHLKDDIFIEALDKITKYLLCHQHISGAIIEADNPVTDFSRRSGDVGVFLSNDDLICDMLYTVPFAALFLPLAAQALNNNKLRDAAIKIITFLTKAMISSERKELDGCYKRAFSIKEWDYFGYNADFKWGPTVIETGWCNSLIGIALCQHLMGTPFLSQLGNRRGYLKH